MRCHPNRGILQSATRRSWSLGVRTMKFVDWQDGDAELGYLWWREGALVQGLASEVTEIQEIGMSLTPPFKVGKLQDDDAKEGWARRRGAGGDDQPQVKGLV